LEVILEVIGSEDRLEPASAQKKIYCDKPPARGRVEGKGRGRGEQQVVFSVHPVEGFYGGTRPRPSCHMDDDGGDAHLFETGEGDGLNLDEDEGTSFPPTVTIIPESNGAGVVELTTAGENASQTLSHGSVRGDRKSECSRAASPKHKLSTVFYCVGFFSPPACPVLPP
jgi:hypothetical protein